MSNFITDSSHLDINLDGLVAEICRYIPRVQGIYLFGSQAAGAAREESDIDLAVLVDETIEVVELWDVAQALAEFAGRDVDLINLRRSSSVMCMQVIAQGRRIACFNILVCEIFEDFVYTDYARLNEERHDILNDIGKRGLVYG